MTLTRPFGNGRVNTHDNVCVNTRSCVDTKCQHTTGGGMDHLQNLFFNSY